MALRFSANLSWLFPELPTLPERLEAAAAAGFGAVEAAWPGNCPAQELRAAAERARVRIALLNTPSGDQEAGELGLAAVPGRQAAFRQALEAAVHYARAVGCPRIHVMAGRVPLGTERAAVAAEMETTFIENLRYAADLLSQEDMTGLLEPINNRITDPRYYLNTPHQAAAILKKVGRPNLKLQLDLFHCQIMDGNLSRNLEMYFPLIGNTLHPHQLHCGHGAGVALRECPPTPGSAVAGWGCGAALGSPCLMAKEGFRQGCLGHGLSPSLPRSYPDCTGTRAARAR
ncbi:putative hydroxypyruvate isomerase isoform X1 [Chamaea fasciata]|uniref:putative hydroxypyruvate isomerase isoform X1 n=1 Tax=Chamaea fasciata TaxID=190680 RepID=UPI00336AD531